MKVKTIAYNLLNGLCDWDFNPYNIPIINKKRLLAAQRLIKEEDPDILCLTEALFSIKNYRGVYMDYQKIFGYPHIDVRDGNTILSKYPIKFSKRIGGQNYKDGGVALYCLMEIGKKTVPISIIHPSFYANESKKTKLIKKLFEEKDPPKIICGDFNSISYSDNYTKEFAENFKEKVILKDSSIDKKLADKIIRDIFKPKVVKYIEGKGLIDTYLTKNKNFDYTVPTDFCSLDKSTGIRIDFIFVSKDIKILDSGIIKNELSEKASDHYPVYAVLEI